MTPDELRLRTKRFALRVIELSKVIPQSTAAARIICKQLIRSATSVGANYRACCRAKSQADFSAKAAIVEEEADESGYWLELLVEAGLITASAARLLIQEAEELTRIMRASRMTARGNAYRQHRATALQAIANP
jgi:four helix bundle protein